MKGIIKYQQKFYKKVRVTRNDIKEGDLIKLECKRKSEYFKYNGIYTVADKWGGIHIKNYNGEGATLCLVLGYNVFDYFKLIEVQRKKTLPMPAKEEQLCGYTV